MAGSQQYTTIRREIVQAGPMDYTVTVEGEYVGSRPTRLEAEALADGFAYGLLLMERVAESFASDLLEASYG